MYLAFLVRIAAWLEIYPLVGGDPIVKCHVFCLVGLSFKRRIFFPNVTEIVHLGSYACYIKV